MLLYIKTQRPTQDITLITFITMLLVPLLGVEPREFFLLRETTLPICPQGQIIWCEWRDSNPQNPDFKSGTYTYSVTLAFGALSEIRTQTVRLLKPPCLPLPPSGHN